MRFITRVWTVVTTVTQWLTLSQVDEYGISQQQQPIGDVSHPPLPTTLDTLPTCRFTPTGSNLPGFQCDYCSMGLDWADCSSLYPGCWIRNTKTGAVYNITQDYETVKPIGIRRNYSLVVEDYDSLNADGRMFKHAKIVNGTFPGPLIEACWGDTLNITVYNNMQYNGTSMHWHGIRQLETMHMDGVNGITQCPIAPGDSYSYVWNVTQYGSSWYHSHYSVQYADGVQGPITLHGPTSAPINDTITPLLVTDWLHNSAFEAQYTSARHPTLLVNGRGNITKMLDIPPHHTIPQPFNITFNGTITDPKTGAKKYLMRVINTSYTTQITFSIDNHYLQVVEADFVPVNASTVAKATSVLIAIGQRYHFVVEAKPVSDTYNPLPAHNNFWIRTSTSGCRDDVAGKTTDYDQVAILRYNDSDTRTPESTRWNIVQNCIDTLSQQLQPVYAWNVSNPRNGVHGEAFDITFNGNGQVYALAIFSIQRPTATDFQPFQTTYGNPTFLNLDNTNDAWPVGWMVVPENFTSKDYVYLVIENGPHPIHLHGHDFAILDYQANAKFNPSSIKPFYYNPVRRDVVLVPRGGYALIAFKTDNPGVWLMHCHIAFHASGGLSMQIMERQADANVIWPPGRSPALARAHSTCAKWNTWAYQCKNQWPGQVGNNYPACDTGVELQTDSGV